MSLVLLIGAGLFVRTLRNLEHVNVGFNQDNLLLSRSIRRPEATKAKSWCSFISSWERGLTRCRVPRPSFGNVPLIAHYLNNTLVILPGETPETASEHLANTEVVRDNYFATMEIPLLRGRAFSDADDEHAARVAVVNETLARKFFPNHEAIGQRIGLGEKPTDRVEIVGIVRDTKYNSQRDRIEPLVYTPWLQDLGEAGRMFFAVRTANEPTALVNSIRQAVREWTTTCR